MEEGQVVVHLGTLIAVELINRFRISFLVQVPVLRKCDSSQNAEKRRVRLLSIGIENNTLRLNFSTVDHYGAPWFLCYSLSRRRFSFCKQIMAWSEMLSRDQHAKG